MLTHSDKLVISTGWSVSVYGGPPGIKLLLLAGQDSKLKLHY